MMSARHDRDQIGSVQHFGYCYASNFVRVFVFSNEIDFSSFKIRSFNFQKNIDPLKLTQVELFDQRLRIEHSNAIVHATNEAAKILIEPET